MDNNKIGKFIKKLREERGWNQEELAEKIYVSRNNLSDIENGKTMLSPDKALFLGNIFNVSIIDIYNGQIMDKSDVVKTNETINSINERIFKSTKLRYLKIIVGIVLCFVLILFLFLAYYFFGSYNSVKFYKINGESENFNTNEGLLVVSKENIHFSLSVESKNNQEIKMLTLRYKDDVKDELIQQVSDNYLYIIDYYNYNEFFDYETIIKEKGTFYLEIEYDDKKESLDLRTIKQYENKRLFFKKATPITDDTEVPERKEVEIPDKILKDFTYEHNAYSYQKKMKNYTIYLGFHPDANIFFASESYKDYTISYDYYIDSNELYYSEIDMSDDTLSKPQLISESTDYDTYKKFFDVYYNKYFK